MKSIYYLLLVSTLLNSCTNSSQTKDLIPTYESFTIKSKHVKETRIINVWTPTEYSKSIDSLPVMYMADGGIKEDFPHIANTLSKLIKSNSIPPIILVGIENTKRRKDLTGYTEVEKDKEIAKVIGGSREFRSFINDELFSEINKQYRTNNKKGIIGESLSGLFVVETLLQKPEMFDFYIAFDPSLWWNDHYLLKTAKAHLKKLNKAKKVFWFAGSRATDISTYTNEFAKILKNENIKSLKWNYSDEPKEKHNTIFRAAKEKAIIWTLGNK